MLNSLIKLSFYFHNRRLKELGICFQSETFYIEKMLIKVSGIDWKITNPENGDKFAIYSLIKILEVGIVVSY